MSEMARIIVCVDDTDDVTKSTSTGAVAEAIAEAFLQLGGIIELGITRHQLLLDESVPYTSHNSSMAFAMRLPAECMEDAHQAARQAITAMKAESADPGLCIASLPDDEDNRLLYELIAFGRAAKERYVPKQEAYELAERIPWLSLEELGGDGQGVVGALAGVGLRLSGNDGRFRGKWDLQAACEGKDPISNKKKHAGSGDGSGGGRGKHRGDGASDGSVDSPNIGSDHSPQTVYPAQRVLDVMESLVNGCVLLVDLAGNRLSPTTPVRASEDIKPLLYAGCMTIVSELDADGVASPCSKLNLDDVQGAFSDMERSCAAFEFDNDLEEFSAAESAATCPNCLYRRWTSGGFTCMRQAEPAHSFSEVIR